MRSLPLRKKQRATPRTLKKPPHFFSRALILTKRGWLIYPPLSISTPSLWRRCLPFEGVACARACEKGFRGSGGGGGVRARARITLGRIALSQGAPTPSVTLREPRWTVVIARCCCCYCTADSASLSVSLSLCICASVIGTREWAQLLSGVVNRSCVRARGGKREREEERSWYILRPPLLATLHISAAIFQEWRSWNFLANDPIRAVSDSSRQNFHSLSVYPNVRVYIHILPS